MPKWFIREVAPKNVVIRGTVLFPFDLIHLFVRTHIDSRTETQNGFGKNSDLLEMGASCVIGSGNRQLTGRTEWPRVLKSSWPELVSAPPSL